MACADCIAHQIGSPELVDRLSGRPGSFPIAGSIELTLRCNVRCKHCYILYPGATSNEMSTADVKATLDKLAQAGVLFLLMTGGEIFARPDFRELYVYAKKLGFLLTLFTNATLVDEDLADFLKAWPPRRVEVTIYGHTEETYENVTGVKGSFRRFRRGIDLMLDRGLKLTLKTIVLKTNEHEFHDIKAWAEGLGVPFRYDAMVNPKLDGDKSPTLERIDPEAVVALEGVDDEKRAFYAKMQALASAAPPSTKTFRCGAGIRTFHIDPRGQLHPCMMWRTTPYDFKQDIEGWTDHLDLVRSLAAPVDSGCNACRHRTGCNNCAATSQLEHGKPGRPIPYYCGVNNAREKLLGISPSTDEARTDNPLVEVAAT